jgi:hypothetical protein
VIIVTTDASIHQFSESVYHLAVGGIARRTLFAGGIPG